MSKPLKYDTRSFVVSTTTTTDKHGIYKYDVQPNQCNRVMLYENKLNCTMHSNLLLFLSL